MILSLPYDSREARDLNVAIFKTIYYHALQRSMELSRDSCPYETFTGSPASYGNLQFHLWGKTEDSQEWKDLVTSIKVHGLRNSLLVAPMPTASTAQIMGNNESFEPYTSNMYTRRVIAGEFVILNGHLVKRLHQENLYTRETLDNITYHRGSVQFTKLSTDAKLLFRTAWELPQKSLIEMAADRAPYICQSQSLNLFIKDANPKIIASAHMYSWKLGLKTGSYYIRTKPMTNSQSFTMDPEVQRELEKECTMCSA
jgi:ribonucleotide reductase alpha subunit